MLAALTALGEQLATDTSWSARNPRIHPQVVTGPWKHLVFGHPARDDGTVDRGACIFCVLEQFCRHLKTPGDLRRDLYAVPRPPRRVCWTARSGEAVKDDVLTTLGLPEALSYSSLLSHVQ